MLCGAPCTPARAGAGRAGAEPTRSARCRPDRPSSRLPIARRRRPAPRARPRSPGEAGGEGTLRSGPGCAGLHGGEGEWQLLGVASGGGGGTSAEREIGPLGGGGTSVEREIGPLGDGGREEAPERLGRRGWARGLRGGESERCPPAGKSGGRNPRPAEVGGSPRAAGGKPDRASPVGSPAAAGPPRVRSLALPSQVPGRAAARPRERGRCRTSAPRTW